MTILEAGIMKLLAIAGVMNRRKTNLPVQTERRDLTHKQAQERLAASIENLERTVSKVLVGKEQKHDR